VHRACAHACPLGDIAMKLELFEYLQEGAGRKLDRSKSINTAKVQTGAGEALSVCSSLRTQTLWPAEVADFTCKASDRVEMRVRSLKSALGGNFGSAIRSPLSRLVETV
jgi:hypothetical protein